MTSQIRSIDLLSAIRAELNQQQQNGSDIPLFPCDWSAEQGATIDTADKTVTLKAGIGDGIAVVSNLQSEDADTYTFSGKIENFKDLPPGTDLNRFMIDVN